MTRRARHVSIYHMAEKSEKRFNDRELSWLAFDERILELAEDTTVPLLERARYLAICSNDLDEFFMVRVAGLKRRIAAGVAIPASGGQDPHEVLAATLAYAQKLMTRLAQCFSTHVRPELADNDIKITRWGDLSKAEREELTDLFERRIYPILTPLAVDPAHPFPYISGLSLNLAVVVHNPVTETDHFARVKIPANFPRFLRVAGHRFVPSEDVIAAHADQLFGGMRVIGHHTFRVTRNEDVELEEDDVENLLTAMEHELSRRRFGPAVRLEVDETIDPHVLGILQRELGVNEEETVLLPAPLDLSCLEEIASLERSDLKYHPFIPATHHDLPDIESAKAEDMFAAISSGDVLVHHPYDSFSTSVQRFIEQAANDPHVLAIKQTLYRTSGDSPIVDALIDAAESGKQVLALVEIKARFDEQANISWARKLERAGVHVVYGLVGLKTHCKLCLVVRDDPDSGEIRRYTHIGTGNYHPKTARWYEDLGLLTASSAVAEDVNHLFNTLSGYSAQQEYRHLLVAPQMVRDGIINKIQREIDHHKSGRVGRIRFKLNALTDESIINALYDASCAGVQVDIWVRGICCLRPGVADLSDNIRVRSVLGRFLEHSRVFAFDNGGDPEYWIGSADLMHRNLDRRVETLVRLHRPEHMRELDQLLTLGFSDSVASWHLSPDATWQRVHRSADGKPLRDLQQVLIEELRHRRSAA